MVGADEREPARVGRRAAGALLRDPLDEHDRSVLGRHGLHGDRARLRFGLDARPGRGAAEQRLRLRRGRRRDGAGRQPGRLSWSGTFGLFVHAGLSASAPSTKVQSACCGYEAALATDSASGETVLAWYSNATGAGGTLAATVLPSLGSTSYLPGSATADRNSAASPVQQVGIAARVGAPGVYVAAAPSGRLWVMWSAGGRLYAVRSNRAVTRFGPVTALAPPPGSSSVWKLVGEGSLGPLDLFVSATAGGGIAFYHRRVLPPLTLAASAGAKGKVGFRVGDAGDPVSGAKVAVGGRTLTTGAGGSAATTLAPGSYRATASLAGYRAATARVRVPKKP
ncbi:MAG: hypothetical protein ACXVZL_02970 [Gaiellaceae bacterium]